MKILKQSIALCFIVFSLSTQASINPQKISIMSNGKNVASFEVPASTKIDSTADKFTSNDDKTKIHLSKNVKVKLTLPSGEVVNINADELEILSTMNERK